MTRRMATAILALVGIFVSLYLALYKAGVIGVLACGAGSCDTVQLSRWASFIGLPVAYWGVAYYVFVLALALAWIQDRWADSRPLALTLLVVTGWGVIFSGYLTYLELFVINAICRYCVASAVIAVVIFGLVLLEWRASRAEPPESAPATLA